MEVKTKLQSLTLNEKEIEELCQDLLTCNEKPSGVGVEILSLNGMEWEEPDEEEDTEDEGAAEQEAVNPNQFN